MRYPCFDRSPERIRLKTGLRKTALLLALVAFFLPQACSSQEVSIPDILSDEGVLCLVNRENKITKKYVPPDLVAPRVPVRKESLRDAILMRAEAAAALENLFEAALREGHVLYAVSGYRSFGIQEILFNSKVSETGSREKAQRSVAPPGASEHQLGLAMDVQCPSLKNLNRSFAETEEGIWTAAHAHEHGFIIRYRKDWESITGVVDEPWHLRYVGIAHATALRRLDLPLEKYLEQLRTLPEYVLTGAPDLLLVSLVERLLAGEEPPADLMEAALPEQREEALRRATLPLLDEGTSYEEALWASYPTPMPPSAPRVDNDEEHYFVPLRGG